MNIELKELKELKDLLLEKQPVCGEINPTERNLGQRIVVLDRGFVYVGDVHEQSDRLLILNAKNIRIWGTTNGLGELRNGPLTGTKLDIVGSVEVYKHAVIHLITCKGF